MSDFISALFTNNGVGVEGLTPLVTVYDLADDSLVLSAVAMLEVGDGIYKKDVTGLLDVAKNYAGFVDAGSDAVDCRYPALDFSAFPAAREDQVEENVFQAMNSMIGVRAVILHVADLASQEPMGNVQVQVYRAGDNTLTTWGYTTYDGNFEMALDDGTYNIILRKMPYSFTVPEVIEVTQDETFTVYGSALIIVSPNPLQNCRLYEFCYKADGVTPMTTVTGTAQLINLPFNANSDRLIASAQLPGSYDPVTGMLYWDIVRGATVQIAIPAVSLSAEVLVPNLDSARVTDLLG